MVNNSLRLLGKRLLFPGIDVGTRKRKSFTKYFKEGDICTLDAGCGNAAFSLEAYRKGNRVLGVDLNPANVLRCQQYVASIGVDLKRCRFEVYNVYDLETRGERFDQVICFELLEHLERDQELLHILHRIIRPGGWLHISTPFLNRTPYYGEACSESEDGSHLRLGYTFEQLEAMLMKAGFSPISRDSAVGPISLKVLQAVYWAKFRMGLLGGVAAFSGLYPFTIFDNLFPNTSRLTIYVMAERAEI